MSQTKITTRDGVRLACRVDGSDDAPALLLLNSLGTDSSIWEPQVAHWARQRRVLRFDQRGHGASEAPTGPYTVTQLAADAVDVLDVFDIDAADVCGLSLGGVVALQLAIDAPSRVRRLVLADTALRVGTREAWQQRADTVRAEGMDAVVGPVMERFFSDGFRASTAPALERVAAGLAHADVEGYAASCEALAAADLGEQAGRVRAPTLVVVGTQDAATPPVDAAALADAVPWAELTKLEGAGHLANLEMPDSFATTVEAFLSTPNGSDAA